MAAGQRTRGGGRVKKTDGQGGKVGITRTKSVEDRGDTG